MTRLTVAAPAKTNLFLEVVRRRDDGFHELDTVFAALALEDTLTLEETAPARPGGAGRLELEVAGDPTVPADATNLVWRAADALRRAAGRPELAARVRVEKRIPAGGGLGGGSSDAAATLVALDRLWGTAVGTARLLQLAAELGSDVPFFVQGGLQRGRGRGEQLEPLQPPVRPLELVLVFPPFGCPTPQVYKALRPHLPGQPGAPAVRGPDAFLAALATGEPRAVAGALWNRLALPAEAEWPALREVRERLAADPRVLGALLSGSGSTTFAVVATAADGQALAADLGRSGLRAVATRTR